MVSAAKSWGLSGAGESSTTSLLLSSAKSASSLLVLVKMTSFCSFIYGKVDRVNIFSCLFWESKLFQEFWELLSKEYLLEEVWTIFHILIDGYSCQLLGYLQGVSKNATFLNLNIQLYSHKIDSFNHYLFYLPGIIVTRSGQILHPYTPFYQVGYVKQEIKHEIHLKGPLSRIGLFQKCLFYPYITLKNPFSKFKIQKKTFKKSWKFWRARAHLLPKRKCNLDHL